MARGSRPTGGWSWRPSSTLRWRRLPGAARPPGGRKIIKNRGHFPSDDAAIKLLWLAIRDIEDKRARDRAKQAGTPRGVPRKAAGRLVEGATVQGWRPALAALMVLFPERLAAAGL